MKNLLKKYYEMNDTDKLKLKDLYILHELETQLLNYKELELDISDEEIIFETIKDILQDSNVKVSEIISRLFKLLKCGDITIDDIGENDIEELIELITKNQRELINDDSKIIKEFVYKDFYCVFFKKGEKYILVYDKDSISHVNIFNNFEEILVYVIKNKLSSEGNSIV